MFADSIRHQCHQPNAAVCGQPNCLRHRMPGMCNRHVEEYVAWSFAIDWCFHCPSMHCSSVVVPFLMKRPCLAWCLITVCYVSQWSVDLSEWVKCAVVLWSHLPQPPMWPVARSVWPPTFLCDYAIETLEFFIVQDSWMCIQLQMVYWVISS